jgi:ribosomal protein L11 methyltransferase
MEWLEVALTVNGELAEAVADVLARYAANGVMTEQGVRFANDEDEGTGEGPITVRAYVRADEKLEDNRRGIEESLYYLGKIQPLPAATFRRIADQNWMEAWKQHYRPIPIGRRLLILPSWLSSTDPDRISIKINPGMAFGTGTHPSTQLCLALMEDVLDDRGKPGSSLDQPISCIDIGCGSGILSIAAVKLGAAPVLGVDIDPESIRNALENAAANEIGPALTLAAGSIREILDGQFSIRSAPLVVVNILAPVIKRLLDEGLVQLLKPAGVLILAGILQEQAEGVVEAAQAHGLHLEERQQVGDWVALAMSK